MAPDDLFLLSLGELNLNKNHQVVLAALSLLQKTPQGLAGVRYGICGEGFARPRLEREIRERGLSQVVTLYGYQRDVIPFLGCADATVFPSRREGLGMAGHCLAAGDGPGPEGRFVPPVCGLRGPLRPGTRPGCHERSLPGDGSESEGALWQNHPKSPY